MDGVSLARLEPGTVREVSAAIASWLIVEGYAEPEMRRQPDDDFNGWSRAHHLPSVNGRGKRRASDR